MWLNELKIAIIEKNTDKLNTLMDSLPELSDAKEINQALHLLKEATSLVEGLRDATEASMIQMQKNIKFLKSTQAPTVSKLDVSS